MIVGIQSRILYSAITFFLIKPQLIISTQVRDISHFIGSDASFRWEHETIQTATFTTAWWQGLAMTESTSQSILISLSTSEQSNGATSTISISLPVATSTITSTSTTASSSTGQGTSGIIPSVSHHGAAWKVGIVVGSFIGILAIIIFAYLLRLRHKFAFFTIPPSVTVDPFVTQNESQTRTVNFDLLSHLGVRSIRNSPVVNGTPLISSGISTDCKHFHEGRAPAKPLPRASVASRSPQQYFSSYNLDPSDHSGTPHDTLFFLNISPTYVHQSGIPPTQKLSVSSTSISTGERFLHSSSECATAGTDSVTLPNERTSRDSSFSLQRLWYKIHSPRTTSSNPLPRQLDRDVTDLEDSRTHGCVPSRRGSVTTSCSSATLLDQGSK